MTARLAIGLVATLPLGAQTIHTHVDPSAPFSSYRTYSWSSAAEDCPDGQIVRQAMDNNLASLGWRLVPSGGDVEIKATLSVHSGLGRRTISNPEDYSPLSPTHYAADYAPTGVLTKNKDLFVQFADGGSGTKVWSAESRWTKSRGVYDPRRDQEDRKLQEVVNELFVKYRKAIRKTHKS